MSNSLLKNSHTNKSTLEIRVTNIEDFNNLLEKVQQKQKELNDTVEELSNYYLKIEFTAENGGQ